MPSIERRIRAGLLRIDGVMAGESVFDEGREAFFVDGRQMAGVFDGFVYLRLTWPAVRANRERLRADARVQIPRSGTDWIHVGFERVADIPLVLELAELAAEQYRPAPGVALRPPPTGADLDRRRRWH